MNNKYKKNKYKKISLKNISKKIFTFLFIFLFIFSNFPYQPHKAEALDSLPTLSTPTSSSVTKTTAILGASLTSVGSPSEILSRGICFGTSPNPSVNCIEQNSTIKVLVVGGGGGGGGSTAGGGGAGGVIENSSHVITKKVYTVTVGLGGNGSQISDLGNPNNTSGQDSVFDTLTAVGGGYGFSGRPSGSRNASNGGSGGGAGGYSGDDIPVGTKGTGTSGQGNDGGIFDDSGNNWGGAGGGGAGGAGTNATGNRSGGIGISSSISGTATYYGGGGGGGITNSGQSNGGLGGGGNGADGNTYTTTAGASNTGGGGGAGGYYQYGPGGAAGGSGIVIISYPTTYGITATGGTITTSGGNTIHTFTTSGSFEVTAVPTLSTIESYAVLASGLTQNTTYYYRGFATNAFSTGYSTDGTFMTDSIPSVTTGSVTSIAITNATGNGNVTSDGGSTITERGLVWNTSASPTKIDNFVTTNGTIGTYTGQLTSLSHSTLYYARAYAINDVGIAYGNEVSFTTLSYVIPTLSTPTSSSITKTTAILGASLTSAGSPSEILSRGICYGTSPNPSVNCIEQNSTIKVLVVGGGGGGGGSTAGGGGAGGVIYEEDYIIPVGSHSVTVGLGGNGSQISDLGNPNNTSGQDSVFDTLTAVGGGYGFSGRPSGSRNASNGGSGGGAGGYSGDDIPVGTKGIGVSGQGNDGGVFDGSTANWGGAGGGGAGGAGTNATGNRSGGIGISSSISGTATYYGGGGGGGITISGQSNGGLGGGGNGADGNTYTTTAGAPNTGGGGGGGGYWQNGGGSAGGSGIVIISYPTTYGITATGGTITTSGGNTIHTFTTSGSFNVTTAPTLSTIESYTFPVSGLAENTTYYYRGFATNAFGIGYSVDGTFTTSVPAVTTGSVTSIATTSATGNGNVTSDGGSTITERGLVWDTSSSPTKADNFVITTGTIGTYTGQLTSLSSTTLYYVRAYAINGVDITYGNEVSFTTNSYAPSVTTQAITSLQSTTATGNGTVVSDGGLAISERGFAWDGSMDPKTTDSKLIVSGTTGVFSGGITGLIENSLYYVRAYAINGMGTSYGSNYSFTTPYSEAPPTILPNTIDLVDFDLDNTPTLEMTATDINNDDLSYNIQISTILDFSTKLEYFSMTDLGFINTIVGGDTQPFNQGEKVSYTIQTGSELADGTYYWRVRAIDQSGSNTYSDWTTIRTFTVGDTNPSPSTYDQAGYRFYDSLDSTDVGSPLDDLNSFATLGKPGDDFRLRMLVGIDTANLSQGGNNFKLQFSQRSGTCDAGFVGENYIDVNLNTEIAYRDNFYPNDKSPIISNINDPIHGADTILNQSYIESNNFTNSVSSINVGEYGLWDFSLYEKGVSSNINYCFRIVESDGTLFDLYSYVPEIKTATQYSRGGGGHIESVAPPDDLVGGGDDLGGGDEIILPICNDTLDNDEDTLIDILDPQCHENGNLEEPYKEDWDSETTAPIVNTGGGDNGGGGGGDLGFNFKIFNFKFPDFKYFKNLMLAMAYNIFY